jgi:hypothetical protein
MNPIDKKTEASTYSLSVIYQELPGIFNSHTQTGRARILKNGRTLQFLNIKGGRWVSGLFLIALTLPRARERFVDEGLRVEDKS